MVKDTKVNEDNGTFIDWHLKLWGESIDASKAELLPMPSEHDDDNHDEIVTTTIAGSTAPIPTASSTTSAATVEITTTDHPDRPTKPTAGTGTEDESKPTETSAAPSETTTGSSWLPSFFPTFGVSGKTQIWIYGAAALILIFCFGLGIYLWMARRKRIRNNPRDEWEFDLLEEDEAEGLNGGRVNNAKRGKRRAGELYDAFATGSEDDEDFGEGGDEREKRLYEDDDGEGSGSSSKHVIGDDDDDESVLSVENEKTSQRDQLLQKRSD